MSTFITNQNIGINLEKAGLGSRTGAFIIDILIVGATLWLINAVFILYEDAWVHILTSLPLFFYSLLFEYFWNGQTPGKKALNIKVVKIDGSRPSFGNYLMRWILRLVDFFLPGLSFAPAIISVIFTEHGQRIGDLAAGTMLIKIRDVKLDELTPTHNKREEYQITFPSVKMLNDAQIELIRKSIEARKTGLTEGGIDEIAAKIKEKLAIETDLPAVKFLYTVVKDYEHIALEETKFDI